MYIYKDLDNNTDVNEYIFKIIISSANLIRRRKWAKLWTIVTFITYIHRLS